MLFCHWSTMADVLNKQGFWYCVLIRFHTMYSNSNIFDIPVYICFQKKVLTSFLTTVLSILKSSSSTSIMIFTWCKHCSAVGRCIKFYGIFFCCFTTPVQHGSNVIEFHNACNILWSGRPGNELDLLARWQDSKWWRILPRSFLIQFFLHLYKKPED